MYFYLEWLNKRPNLITILTEKPSNYTFMDTFLINKQIYHICGNISDTFEDFHYSSELIYTKNQYLSSQLQKSIRRMKHFHSAKIANNLIHLDINCLLRRLPIIMLEDVSIHESFAVLVWLMIASSKGFIIKNEIIKWILGITYYLSKETMKTDYNKLYDNFEWNQADYDHYENTLLFSLQFRKAYGGMKGDMGMIEYYKQLIINRNITILKTTIPILKLDIPQLQDNEWIYEGNDFHCNRYILKKIQLKHKDYDENYIKELIWIFSSSINYRIKKTHIDINKETDWNIIKPTVISVQKSCPYK